ncbi:hypothetical protein DFH09DRAFT_1152056 [Mycena vulgaris]|nr:hypothetical protein DFH09DRAFT_1152056 [Mycena vulgaris]
MRGGVSIYPLSLAFVCDRTSSLPRAPSTAYSPLRPPSLPSPPLAISELVEGGCRCWCAVRGCERAQATGCVVIRGCEEFAGPRGGRASCLSPGERDKGDKGRRRPHRILCYPVQCIRCDCVSTRLSSLRAPCSRILLHRGFVPAGCASSIVGTEGVCAGFSCWCVGANAGASARGVLRDDTLFRSSRASSGRPGPRGGRAWWLSSGTV